MKKTRQHQSFLYGAIILVMATGLTKVIGVVFRLPLANMIGGVGMGYFSNAYDLYTPIYSLAMAGLPIAISRMVAENVSANRYKDAKQILKIARRVLLITGLGGFLIMVLISYPYVMFTGNKNALPSILIIAPSLLFCCIMSSYRGYYEGMRNMYPTAISSLIEALCKMLLGLGFAYGVLWYAENEFRSKGTVFGQLITSDGSGTSLENIARLSALPYAAAGAVAAITIGTVLGALFLILRYKIKGDGITQQELASSAAARPYKENLKQLIMIAIPVVMGSLVSSVASLVDLATVNIRLMESVRLNPEAFLKQYGGYLPAGTSIGEIPNFLYGVYKGYVFSFFNLIPTITTMLGVSALPNIATLWIKQDKPGLKINIESVVRITSLICFPIGIGISVLADPILHLFYGSNPGEVAVSIPLLSMMGICGIFAGLSVPLTNMLQGIGKQKLPVRNMFLGALVKLAVNFIFVAEPSVNIRGAAIGSLCCYSLIFILNFYDLCKYSNIVPNIVKSLIKPLVSGLMCGAAGWASYGLLSRYLSSNALTLGIAVGIAGIVYLICLFLLRTITREDVLMLPKGDKLAKTLEKLHCIG